MLCLIHKSLKNVQTYMQKSNFCDYLIEVPLAINFLHYFSTKYRNFPLSGNSAPGPPLPLAYNTHSSPPPPHHDHSNISRHCQQLPRAPDTEIYFVRNRDVNDNTSSSILKLRYRIVSITKRNENVQN